MTIIALTRCGGDAEKIARFTQEIFGMFVVAIFVSAGGQALADYFTSDEYDLAHGSYPCSSRCSLCSSACGRSPFARRRFCCDSCAKSPGFRHRPAITVGTLVAWGAAWTGGDALGLVDYRGWSRLWVVDLREGPSWLSVACVVPGALLALLMYVEMNVSSLLANKPENNLTKGPAYHLNFLVMALTQLVFSFFGLPPMTGSLPHSPQFIRALSDVEEITVGGQTKTKVIRANENRVAPLAVYSLIALTLVMLPALRMIPMAVLYGLFLLLGITGMATSQLWTRTKMIAMDPRLLPPTHYVRRVPISRVHAFTGVQLCCAALLLGVRASPAALFFPLFIAPDAGDTPSPVKTSRSSAGNAQNAGHDRGRVNAEAGAEEAKAVDMGGNLGEGERPSGGDATRDAPRGEPENRSGAADDGKTGYGGGRRSRPGGVRGNQHKRCGRPGDVGTYPARRRLGRGAVSRVVHRCTTDGARVWFAHPRSRSSLAVADTPARRRRRACPRRASDRDRRRRLRP